jgi:hypothetical protein
MTHYRRSRQEDQPASELRIEINPAKWIASPSTVSTYPESEALTEEKVRQGSTEWNKERRQHDKYASASAKDTEQADVEEPSDD